MKWCLLLPRRLRKRFQFVACKSWKCCHPDEPLSATKQLNRSPTNSFLVVAISENRLYYIRLAGPMFTGCD